MKKTITIIGIFALFLLTAVGAFVFGRHSQNGTKEDVSVEKDISQDASKGNEVSQNEKKQEEASPSPKPVTISASGENEGEITYTTTASWGDDNVTYTQIDAVITNQSEQEMASWEVNLTVPKGSKLNQGWNGKMELKGNRLKILPEDYNAVIAAGQTANFGFIIETPSSYVPKESELVLQPSKP